MLLVLRNLDFVERTAVKLISTLGNWPCRVFYFFLFSLQKQVTIVSSLCILFSSQISPVMQDQMLSCHKWLFFLAGVTLVCISNKTRSPVPQRQLSVLQNSLCLADRYGKFLSELQKGFKEDRCTHILNQRVFRLVLKTTDDEFSGLEINLTAVDGSGETFGLVNTI